MKIVIFSHGRDSGPNGTKIKVLSKVAESHGFETASIDYTKCENANERIERLKEFIESKNAESIVLVGSSMGGYVSTVVAYDYKLAGLFLLCPALFMADEEYTIQNYLPMCDHIEIVHGWDDPTVPCDSSIKFGRQTKAVLNLIDDNHSLEHSHAFLEKRFGEFLKNIN
ncbi:alpha/beta hydrolase [Cryomorpha ignava]|uniref:Alpha/beta hydrolase n=1 Tax=Cryomorpha ignava TaxID=101383 RepID=A0A7K3WVM8_9FLAO|nr:YqiA/YcfP family alpha/beta fold hydrolase [Cryomorpha ignava]NEN25554.1 alpha/beta hydrolase [Cryomorpha ignava]